MRWCPRWDPRLQSLAVAANPAGRPRASCPPRLLAGRGILNSASPQSCVPESGWTRFGSFTDRRVAWSCSFATWTATRARAPLACALCTA
eukprot:4637764-Alexandrium_andersonii.AAC.1